MGVERGKLVTYSLSESIRNLATVEGHNKSLLFKPLIICTSCVIIY
jgi:hypothetical protein